MESKLTTIDPALNNLPETAHIQKITSENDRLPNGEHEKAVKAFYSKYGSRESQRAIASQ